MINSISKSGISFSAVELGLHQVFRDLGEQNRIFGVVMRLHVLKLVLPDQF